MRKLTRAAIQRSRAANSCEASCCGTVLIVEPDALTRWSLEVYLASWFRVLAAAELAEAERVLAREPVQALVISDALGERAAGLERSARAREPNVRIVRTGAEASRAAQGDAGFLEKPFELARLARLLGVEPSTIPRRRRAGS